MAASGVRIVAGRLKGRALRVPPGVRPSGARLREALFSRWQDRLQGVRFLDLFAGSGAMLLEAWSRGAEHVFGVESEGTVWRTLQSNVGLAPWEAVTLFRARLPEGMPRLTGIDLAFADPPYAFRAFEELVLAVAPSLDPAAELALEHAKGTPVPDEVGGWRRDDRRKYGDSVVTFYVKSG